MLILLYPHRDAGGTSRKVDEIRAAYVDQFDQESVLRADDPKPSCVSF